MLVAKKALESLGAIVVTAENGQEAIDKINDADFDIVLMDIQMPILDGYSATKRLRNMGFNRPIMALSANVYNDHIEKSHECGMNGHLQKPFTRLQLFHAVADCLKATHNVNA